MGWARCRAEGLCPSARGRGRGTPQRQWRRGWGPPPYSSWGGLTISQTHCGPGSHCPGPASRAHTSRAAGSSTTSPAPGETERPVLREGRKGAPQNRPPGRGEAGSPPRWAAGFRSGLVELPPLHAQGTGGGAALTALKDASRGQWPKQCCRKRYSFCCTNLGTAALQGQGRQQSPGHPAGLGQGLLPAAPSSESTLGAQHRTHTAPALPAPAGLGIRPRPSPARVGSRGWGRRAERLGSLLWWGGSETGLPAAPTSVPGGIRGPPPPTPTS